MLMAGLVDLEVRHLLALDAVAAEGTFGKAAIRLGYTQSAVSQQIAALERVVDGKLFDRPGGPRPVELTPLGERVLDQGRDLLSRVRALSEDLDRFRSGDVGQLRIGTFQSASATLLPAIIAQLRVEHPLVEITLLESDDDAEVAKALEQGLLDLAFVVGDGPPGCESVFLLSDPWVVMAKPGDFESGPIPVAQLGEVPLIGQANRCQLANERALRDNNVDPDYVFRTNDNATVAAMVRAGLGVALLPLLCIETEDPRLVLHKTAPDLPERPISLAWRSDRTLPPLAGRFIDLARDSGAELAARSKG